MTKDRIYAEEITNIEDFVFDERVCSVFEDMIDRSVPGYRSLISNLGVVASQFIQSDSCVYDLGCSLGTASIAIYRSAQRDDFQIIAVDNSKSMLIRCSDLIAHHNAESTIQTRHEDLLTTDLANASVVILNLTLQFLDTDSRESLIKKIYQSLAPGGALIITEKTIHADSEQQALLTTLHESFKRANHYSELEVSQKRKALENVLVSEPREKHIQRMQNAGFNQVTTWFQCFNFMSFLALK